MEANSGASPVANPWLTVWLRPQRIISEIVNTSPHRGVIPIGAALGVYHLLSGLPSDRLHWFAAIIMACFIGTPLGIAGLYIASALLRWFGRLLGGEATQLQLRAVVAWSSVPNVVALLLFTIALILLRHDPLAQSLPGNSGAEVWGTRALALTLFGLGLWALFLLVRMVGAVQKFGLMRSIANSFLPMAISFLLALVIRVFFFQPFSLPGASMEPTQMVGDYFFVNKVSYGYSKASFPFGPQFAGRILGVAPKRGDLVVFLSPKSSRTYFVKRVVGLPGDEIQMNEGALVVNGHRVHLQDEGDFTGSDAGGQGGKLSLLRETLSDGVSYSVLDQNQNGPFDNTSAFKVPSGHCFVLGDNRDHSTDSRAQHAIGFVPLDNVSGKVVFILFSAGRISGSESIVRAFSNIRWERMFRVP